MPIDLPDAVPFITRNLILNLQGLQFKHEGIYYIDLSLDEELINRVPLRVLLIDEGAEEQPA